MSARSHYKAIFLLWFFTMLFIGNQLVEGQSLLDEDQGNPYQLVRFEYYSIHQIHESLPIFSNTNNIITSINSGENFFVKNDEVLNSIQGPSYISYSLSINEETFSISEILNSEIHNYDIYSVDFFHKSFSEDLKLNILIPQVDTLQSNILRNINTSGNVQLIENDEEFGIMYSSNYFSNDLSNQTLNVNWEYRFDKTTGILRKYTCKLEQDIIIYGDTGTSYRDTALRDIEIIGKTQNEDLLTSPGILIIGSVLVVLLLSSYILYLKLLKPSKLIQNKVVNDQIKGIVKEVFGKYATSYFVIGQNFVKREHIEQKDIKIIPLELLEHKFLMSPVRLSITKLLMENTVMSFSELRNHLGISWGEFSTNTKAMESKGYIRVEEKFVDNTVKKVVSLEPLGINKYEQLINLLINFIDQAPLYDKYIDNAIRTSKRGKN